MAVVICWSRGCMRQKGLRSVKGRTTLLPQEAKKDISNPFSVYREERGLKNTRFLWKTYVVRIKKKPH